MDSGTMDSTVIGKGKVGTHKFMMYEYKTVLCPQTESHIWEKCLYAHKGERARRRHPSKYQAIQCPEARAKKVCPRGDDCNCTHHLFEYWLHPDRYMTCLCELGPACNRPICFFAHHPSELRPLPPGLTHPEGDTFQARRRERQKRSGAGGVSAGNSSDPFATNNPTSSGGGSACLPVPASAASAGESTVTILNRPNLNGLSDAFGALELLSLQDTAATAVLPVSVAPASQGLQQKQLSARPAPPEASLQTPLLDTAIAVGASQQQGVSSTPSLVSSSSHTMLTQQQQLVDALQQRMPLGSVIHQDHGFGQSACSGSCVTLLSSLTGARTEISALEVPPVHSLALQAIKPSLEMTAGVSVSMASTSRGCSPPAAAQLQQQQQTVAQLCAQNTGVSLSTVPSVSFSGSNCSSPSGLTSGNPVGLNRAALGLIGSDAMLCGAQCGVSALGTGLRLGQPQQQLSSTPAVVLDPIATQQLTGGLVYVQAASPPTVPLLQQQQQQQQMIMVPAQLMDDPHEQLSFSMWGPDATYPLPQQPQMTLSPQQQYMQQQQQPSYWQQHSQQQQQQAAPLPLNANPAGGVASRFQGLWQQQQVNQLLQMQWMQGQLPDSRTQGM